MNLFEQAKKKSLKTSGRLYRPGFKPDTPEHQSQAPLPKHVIEHSFFPVHIKVKLQESRYRPGACQSFPGGLGSHIP